MDMAAVERTVEEARHQRPLADIALFGDARLRRFGCRDELPIGDCHFARGDILRPHPVLCGDATVPVEHPKR